MIDLLSVADGEVDGVSHRLLPGTCFQIGGVDMSPYHELKVVLL